MIPAPPVDYTAVEPELLWAVLVGGSFLGLLFFGAVTVLIRRLDGYETLERAEVEPIPRAIEFDSNLSSELRRREREWLESLMESPAFGEKKRRGWPFGRKD